MKPMSVTPSLRTLQLLSQRTQRWPFAFPPGLEAAYAAARRRQGRLLRALLLCMPLLALWAVTGQPEGEAATQGPGWLTGLTVASIALMLLTAAVVARAPRLGERAVRWLQIAAITVAVAWLLGLRLWLMIRGGDAALMAIWLATAWILVSAFGRYRWHYLLPGIVISAAILLLQDAVMSSDQAGLLHRESLITLLLFAIAATLSVHQDRTQRLMWLIEQSQTLLSRVDSLTGLAHRHEWNIRLAQLWAQARRESRSLSLALIDINRFGAFNAQHGHGTGDRALCALADQLKPLPRAEGACKAVARYADDQFAVVWMGLDAAAAQRAQSRLEMLLGGLDVPDALQQSAEVFTRVAMVHLESVAQKTPDVVEAQLRRALVEAGHAALVAPASVAAGVPLQA
tara:strand:+ start:2163 stop:3362 length:1200 start_codon:yes stop_codon:yes gene_type:complete